MECKTYVLYFILNYEGQMLMLMMSVCQCNAKEEQDMRIICIAASIADIMLSAAFKQNQQSFSRSCHIR